MHLQMSTKAGIRSLETVKGNLLDTDAPYIMHQCDCVTVRATGLAKEIKDRFLHGDVYGARRAQPHRNCAVPMDRAMPGTIEFIGHGPSIIAIFGQHLPGKPGEHVMSYPDDGYKDDAKAREAAFARCMSRLVKHFSGRDFHNITIACPYGIGCGSVGGDWEKYLAMLEIANTQLPQNVRIVLYSPH